jgi:LPS-assembly protein
MDNAKLEACLGWQDSSTDSICHGHYRDPQLPHLAPETWHIGADQVALVADGRSSLQGAVEVTADQQQISASNAYVMRDAKTKDIQRIELIDNVHYLEPQREIWASRVALNPGDKSAEMSDALYRIKTDKARPLLPAWGLARFIERLSNQDLRLQQVTYSTCPPKTRDWLLSARDIYLDHQAGRGVAHDVWFKWHDWPLLYTPYLSFPTSKARKSGFLMPVSGYSNVGGFDLAAPFYWNMAPNYDATITPHAYTFRGVMLGAEVRWLSESSSQLLSANILPSDQAYRHFLNINAVDYPQLRNQSDNRWSLIWRDDTIMNDQLTFGWNYQRLSDDYYLQDFSSNLVLTTTNQLQQTGFVNFTTDHWALRGTAEAYQTLNPINQAAVSPIYQRLPQLVAHGMYDELPGNTQLNLIAQYDQFRWPVRNTDLPQGARLHAQPTLSSVLRQPWGYVQPQVEWVGNYYQSNNLTYSIPRYSVDSGLFFERQATLFSQGYTQTVEPRLYYLNVPYQNQSAIPAFDSAYMIFSMEQLFRANRFSGIDRIGDANQLAYAVTSRWLSDRSGRELASIAVGQLRYFSDRQVQLCYQVNGECTDSPLLLGYLSPTATTSPIATRATVQLTPVWSTDASWIWDTATRATNNTNINLAYQPELNRLMRVGYSYLVSGNVYQGMGRVVENTPLHQATVAAAWPLTPQWSAMGVYSYNISEQYDMLSFVGAQYDTCCWALRFMGGRVFDSLSNTSINPKYNNNVYVQIVLKGLGSLGVTDPASTIQSYLPGYVNSF